MCSATMDHNNKIAILGQIYENKEILFGKFSEKLTHEIKIKKWKDLAEQLRAMGIYNKDWKYLRDTTWQNWRKRTMEKRDNRLQTGSGGGKKCKYDDSDELVLKIIGHDSPAIQGLNVPESSGSNEPEVCLPVSTPETTTIIETPPLKKNTFRKPQPQRVSFSEADISNDLIDLKKQKMALELELLKHKVEISKREQYKLDLELLKLEKELDILHPSKFTLPLYLQNVQIIDSTVQNTNNQDVQIIASSEEYGKINEDIVQAAINKSLIL